jgi:hypothetical protein
VGWREVRALGGQPSVAQASGGAVQDAAGEGEGERPRLRSGPRGPVEAAGGGRSTVKAVKKAEEAGANKEAGEGEKTKREFANACVRCRQSKLCCKRPDPNPEAPCER